MARKVIIAIDGGGIRGILPLNMLHDIFQHEADFSEDIEFEWWGTSSGALISASINLNRLTGAKYQDSVRRTLDFFELRSSGLIPKAAKKIDHRGFNLLITHVFGELTLNQVPLLNIVATDVVKRKAKVFTQEDLLVSLALRASCAIPGMFPPVEIQNGSYVDGFVAAKNPSELAIDKNNSKPAVFISLGTGQLKTIDPIEEEVFRVEQTAEAYCASNQIPYFRLNPPIILASEQMDNNSVKNIFNLNQDAYNYLNSNEKVISEIFEQLK